VRDHVHFEITWWRVIPILKSPHGDALAKRRVHARSAPALPGDIAYRTKQPINRGSAHGEQLIASFGRKVEVSVTFHGGYEYRDGLLQTLAADAIGGLPQNR
jgi:hypothetical protein